MATYECKKETNSSSATHTQQPDMLTELRLPKAEHNISETEQSAPPRRRPDLSSFYSHLEYVHNPQNSTTSPPPRPTDVVSAYRMLANSLQPLLGDVEGFDRSNMQHNMATGTVEERRQGMTVISDMIQQLMNQAEAPPDRPERVPDSFFDQLERVSKQQLQKLARDQKEELSCPICRVPFLDDERPLVVKLPCNAKHMYDMECIQPWLMLNVTCPLDRQRLIAAPKGPELNRWEESLQLVYDDSERMAASTKIRETEELSEDVDGMYG